MYFLPPPLGAMQLALHGFHQIILCFGHWVTFERHKIKWLNWYTKNLWHVLMVFYICCGEWGGLHSTASNKPLYTQLISTNQQTKWTINMLKEQTFFSGISGDQNKYTKANIDIDFFFSLTTETINSLNCHNSIRDHIFSDVKKKCSNFPII